MINFLNTLCQKPGVKFIFLEGGEKSVIVHSFLWSKAKYILWVTVIVIIMIPTWLPKMSWVVTEIHKQVISRIQESQLEFDDVCFHSPGLSNTLTPKHNITASKKV